GRFFDLAMDEIGRYGGSVNKFMGDGFMALMGVPVAHEDHARRAVLAALSLRRRIDAELNPTLPEPLVVRTGLSTGLVVVGGVGGDPGSKVTAIGDTVNVAARLERLADPGAILISEATARYVEGYARCELVGTVEVAGRTEPVIVHRVLGVGPRRSRLE